MWLPWRVDANMHTQPSVMKSDSKTSSLPPIRCVLNLVSAFYFVVVSSMSSVTQSKMCLTRNSAKKNEKAQNIGKSVQEGKKIPTKLTERQDETRREKKFHKTSRHFQRFQFQSQRKPICFFYDFHSSFHPAIVANECVNDLDWHRVFGGENSNEQKKKAQQQQHIEHFGCGVRARLRMA